MISKIFANIYWNSNSMLQPEKKLEISFSEFYENGNWPNIQTLELLTSEHPITTTLSKLCINWLFYSHDDKNLNLYEIYRFVHPYHAFDCWYT